MKGNLAVAVLLLIVSLGYLTNAVSTQVDDYSHPNQVTSTIFTSPATNTNVTEKGLGWIPEPSKPTITATRTQTYPYLPQRFDWTDYQGYNWMTPIRNQGGCGSCTAFATVGVVEAQYKISYSRPDWNIDLSEQHLFSCGQEGHCSYGMSISDAMNYERDYGTPDEACYPYGLAGWLGIDRSCSGTCSDWQSRAYKIYNWTWVSATVPEIEAAIISGPVLAAFIVNEDFYNHYSSGVYHWDHKSNAVGGHAVVIVGYDNVEHYWKVRNSWGPGWGENGYFRIGFGECGIEQNVVSVTAIAPTPPNHLTVQTDRPSYSLGEIVHISGEAVTPSVTWTYTSPLGLQVEIQIFDPNNSLIHTGTSDPNAAGYKRYAYEYRLGPNAVPGTYRIHVRSSPVGREWQGEGYFSVVATSVTMTSTTLSIWFSPSTVDIGGTVTVTAMLTPALSDRGLWVYESKESAFGPWNQIGTCWTDSSGRCSMGWQPYERGTYFFRAEFMGDASHFPSSTTSEPYAVTVIPEFAYAPICWIIVTGVLVTVLARYRPRDHIPRFSAVGKVPICAHF